MQKILTLLIISIYSLNIQANTPKKQNFLVIIVDDLRCSLEPYGDTDVKTPQINKLAAEGVCFQKAYVQQAICSASRASFLTGCRPDSTGVNFPYTKWFKEDFVKKYPTLLGHFTSLGYYTRSLGKVHHGDALEPLSEAHFKGDKGKGNDFQEAKNIQAYYTKKGNNRLKTNVTKVRPWEHADRDDKLYPDGKLTNEAIATIKRAQASDKGFFITVGYQKPHLPFVCPKKYYDLYATADIPLAQQRQRIGEHELTTPKSGALKWWNYKQIGYTDSDHLQLSRSYLACVSFIDAQIGKVLDSLDQQGLRDSTTIVLMSDHGYHFGDHGHWGKASNFEVATRAPLIVSSPGFSKKGQNAYGLVEFVDIFPTLLDLAGAKPLSHLEGNSFTPLLTNPEQTWKKAAFSQYPRGKHNEGYSLTDGKYRYTVWKHRKKGKILHEELYLLDSDPECSKNLAKDKVHLASLQEMQKLSTAGWKNALPKGLNNLSSLPKGDDSEYQTKKPKKK